MSAPGADRSDPGAAVERVERSCRSEATRIRMRAAAEAEEQSAAALAAANRTIERRISRLRELRDELAAASERIERDLNRAAREIGRRAESTYPRTS